MMTRVGDGFEVAEARRDLQRAAKRTATESSGSRTAWRGAALVPSALANHRLMLDLQRLVGNTALVSTLRGDRLAVQRCGDHACPPSGCTPEAKEAALEQEQTTAVQRFWPFDSEEEDRGGRSGGGGSTDDYGGPDAGVPGVAPKQSQSKAPGASENEENASYDDTPNQSLARPWKCNSSCNVEGTEPQCTGRVTGYGEGPTEGDACRSAKRDATQKAPRGCYARHCQCDCSQ